MHFSLKSVAMLALGAVMMVSQFGSTPARAHDGGDVAVGVVGGFIAGTILGGAVERDSHRYCHLGPMECHMARRPCFHNDFGEYICPPPRERCFRREYCD